MQNESGRNTPHYIFSKQTDMLCVELKWKSQITQTKVYRFLQTESICLTNALIWIPTKKIKHLILQGKHWKHKQKEKPAPKNWHTYRIVFTHVQSRTPKYQCYGQTKMSLHHITFTITNTQKAKIWESTRLTLALTQHRTSPEVPVWAVGRSLGTERWRWGWILLAGFALYASAGEPRYPVGCPAFSSRPTS